MQPRGDRRRLGDGSAAGRLIAGPRTRFAVLPAIVIVGVVFAILLRDRIDDAAPLQALATRLLHDLTGAVAKPAVFRDGGPTEKGWGRAVSDFEGRDFEGEIVLWAVR